MISQNQVDKFKNALDYLLNINVHVYLSELDYGSKHEEISFLITPKFTYQKKSITDYFFANKDKNFTKEYIANKKLVLNFDTFKGFNLLSNWIADNYLKNPSEDFNFIIDGLKTSTITANIQNKQIVYGGANQYKSILFARSLGLNKTLKLIDEKACWINDFFQKDMDNLPVLNLFFKKANYLNDIESESIKDRVAFLKLLKKNFPNLINHGKETNNLLFLNTFLSGNEDALKEISSDFKILEKFLDNVSVEDISSKALEKKNYFDISVFSFSQLKNIITKEKKSINLNTRLEKILISVNEFKFLNEMGYLNFNSTTIIANDSLIISMQKNENFKESISEKFKDFFLQNVLEERFSTDNFEKKLLEFYLKNSLVEKNKSRLSKI